MVLSVLAVAAHSLAARLAVLALQAVNICQHWAFTAALAVVAAASIPAVRLAEMAGCTAAVQGQGAALLARRASSS